MSTLNCPKCGQPSPPGAQMCVRCGNPLTFAPPPPQPPQKKGMSTFAIVGICLAVGGLFLVVVVGIIAAIAIPSLIRARAAANEAATIGRLRMVAAAEATFQSTHYRYGDLSELVSEGLVSSSVVDTSPENGYRFRQVGVSMDTFDIAAEPDGGVSSGSRAFNVTEDFVIRYAPGTVAPKGTSGTVLGMD